MGLFSWQIIFSNAKITLSFLAGSKGIWVWVLQVTSALGWASLIVCVEMVESCDSDSTAPWPQIWLISLHFQYSIFSEVILHMGQQAITLSKSSNVIFFYDAYSYVILLLDNIFLPFPNIFSQENMVHRPFPSLIKMRSMCNLSVSHE